MSSDSPKRKKPYSKAHGSPAATALGAICSKGTIAAVAAKIGASESSVRHYLTGRRSPTPTARGRIAEVYGIRSGDWTPTTAPKASGAGPSALVSAPTDTPPSTPTPSLVAEDLTGRARLAAIVGRLEVEIAKCDGAVPRNHVAALYGQLTSAVHRLARLDGEGELTVGGILRSRAWGELEGLLESVLRKYPGAAEELVTALDARKEG